MKNEYQNFNEHITIPSIVLALKIESKDGEKKLNSFSVAKEYIVDSQFDWAPIRKYFEYNQVRLTEGLKDLGYDKHYKVSFVMKEREEKTEKAIRITKENMVDLMEEQMYETYKKFNKKFVMPLRDRGLTANSVLFKKKQSIETFQK